MAKVISWQIPEIPAYVYIEPLKGNYIHTTRIDVYDPDLVDLLERAKRWTQDIYVAKFTPMYEAVVGRFGTTNLHSNALDYWDVLDNSGVYMIGGADGINTADYGKPFYNLVIENNNTSVGLGGNYVLDKRTDLYTKIYLERNGAFFAPPASDISIADEAGATTSFSTETVSENGIAKTRIKLTIPANTQFDEDYPIKEYTITVVKGDSYTGKTVFTVVGVKDGEEGASYDLVVKPRQIKVTADGDVSNEAVTCSAVRNGIEVINENGTKLVDELNLQIKYDFGTITDDVDDISNVYSGGISYQDIAENGDQVNFYLIFNGRYLVDSDSCTISRDGKDNGTLKLELDNEIDGISVGSDTKLDISEPVTSSTGFVLYSGGTELEILNSGQNKIKVENLGQNASWTVYGSENNTGTSVEGKKKGWIKFTLNNQFDFGEDYKDSVKITVWGQNEHGEIASATTNYIIMGIRGGKDGEVFKIIPNLDVILCDPNNADTPYSGETHLTAEAYVGTDRIENAEITYSLNVTYGNAYNHTVHLPAAGLDIADLITGASYVALYLWTGDTSNPSARILVDRETIPIIWQGANGSAAWVELGNEIDAVSVGWDTDLDLDEELTSVTVGTTVRVISGDTPIQIQNIRIIAPNGKENKWASTTIRTTGWSGDDEEEDIAPENKDNDTHTIARVFITLLDGFDFDEDLREQATIAVTAGTQDHPWYGYAHYVIKGIPGGKDGYVYRLVPEVDYINFHPNEGPQGTLDFGQSTITCDAYYGSIPLSSSSGDPEANFGEIYYSFNKICTSTGDTETEGYVTGMTIYPSNGVEIDGLITRNNYTNFKYLVFYLVVDGEIVDRETVPIIADGLNAGERLYVELGNEIDSVGTGADTKLDLVDPVTASTTVTLFSGATELLITGVSGKIIGDSSSAHSSTAVYIIDESGNTTSSSPSFSNPAKKVEFNVYLENGFEFGKDLKEKVLLEVSGLDLDGSAVTAYATFVIAAVVGGKDGAAYKIQPTPDYVVYDFNLPGFIGTNNVSAKAYCSGVEMTGDTYEILYGFETVYDLDNVDISVLDTYTGPISFPAPVSGRENRIAFYLKVGDKIVDRETVPLVVNGKNGENGSGSVSFDLSNENWVVTTGEDTKLDIVDQITGGTRAVCVSGNTNVVLHVVTAGTLGNYATVVVEDNDTISPFVKVTLRKNFDFGQSQRKEITVSCTGGTGENAVSGVLTFGLVCVRNGKGGDEGKSYKIVTSAGSILYDSNNETYGPMKLTCKMYLGNDEVSMATCKYTIHDNETNSDVITNSNFPSAGLTDYRNVRLGSILISGTAIDGGWDACDVPIIPSGKDGSGIVIDLTNDRDTVALGEDLVLDNSVEFSKTYASVYEGSSTCDITRINIETPSIAQANKLTITSGVTSGNKSAWLQVAIASPFNFSASDIEGGQIPIYAVVSATTSEGTVQKRVKYTILGFQGGEDGVSYQIVPSSSVIKRNIAADTYTPEGISAGINVGLNNSDPNVYMYYTVNEEDGEDATYEPYGPTVDGSVVPNGYPKPVLPLTGSSALFVTDGLRNAVNFYAFYGGTNVTGILVDKETVPVVFDGNDGAGTLTIQVSPTSIPIPVNEQGHPEGLVTGRTLVSMWSGTTQISINAINVTTSYSDFGNETSNKNVKYKISSAEGSYEWVSFSATTNATITGKIEIELEAIALGTGGMSRRAVITIEPAIGKNGRNGAAVLGPTQFEDNGIVGRRWHSGNDNVLPGDTPTPEDLQFIDIIVRVENGQKVYYYCNTSYTDTGAAWSTVSSRWTQSQEQYDFVATKLLLAENAKINFVTGNELYLTNSAGTVTGGARAASSSDDVVFWAGSDQPGNGNFQVTYNGDLIAKSGKFSGYIQMPYTHIGQLNQDTSDNYLADERAYLVSDQYQGSGYDGGRLKLPLPTPELNGFTYFIIQRPRMTGGEKTGINVFIETDPNNDGRDEFLSFCFDYNGYVYGFKDFDFVCGSCEITCVPWYYNDDNQWEYKWIMTKLSGTIEATLNGTYKKISSGFAVSNP